MLHCLAELEEGRAGGSEVRYLAHYVCHLLACGGGDGIGCHAGCEGGGWVSMGAGTRAVRAGT